MTLRHDIVHRILAAVALLGVTANAGSACTDLGAECRETNCLGDAGTSGVGGQGGSSASSGTATGGGLPTSCDPRVEGTAVADSCGVFVSRTKGSDGSQANGTKERPFASIGKALEQVELLDAPALYLCAETFDEAVAIPSGLHVFGGLDCAGGWAYSGDKATIHGPANAIPVVIAGAKSSMLHDLAIVASDASDVGKSSVALMIRNATVALERVELIAGKGAPGAAGDTPAGTGKDGVAGTSGKSGCTNGSVVVPDNGPTTSCDGDEESVSGLGGLGNVNDGGAGLAGGATPTITNPNGGAGQLASGGACGIGKSGLEGAPGAPGDGAMGLGSIDDKLGYIGVVGGSGKSNGKPGQGGGGGGGASGKQACVTLSHAGPSGGSGGAGGCGGKPGNGGLPGGSSIALLTVNAKVTLADSLLTASAGGAGGAGSGGQPGGAGFVGGKGGMGNKASGCDGGKGGDGGRGGAGGGGLGGHSLGIAHKGTAPVVDEATVTITVGQAGTGGGGGNGGPSNIGAKGADGVAEPVKSFTGG